MRIVLLLLCFFASAAHAGAFDQFRTFVSGTKSARAAFEQKVYDRSGRLVQASKGSFVFQRPGRFRWVYDKPVDQVIVGDGERVWIYDRALNQVTVRKIAAALGSTPAALLAGDTEVGKAFEFADGGTRDGIEWLEAKPREREAGFERVRIGFAAEGGLRGMELMDHFGQTTRLEFSGLVRNPKVDPKEFRFDPPKGSDVLGDK